MFIIAQIPFVDMRLLIKNQNANCFFRTHLIDIMKKQHTIVF